MRKIVFAAALAVSLVSAPAWANDDETEQQEPAAPKYSTADSEIGELLDDPEARAIIEKHIPALVGNDQLDMARTMTLKSIQQYAPEEITDERLAAIDADLAQLK